MGDVKNTDEDLNIQIFDHNPDDVDPKLQLPFPLVNPNWYEEFQFWNWEELMQGVEQDRAFNFQENLNLDQHPVNVDHQNQNQVQKLNLDQCEEIVENPNLGQENVHHHNQDHNLNLYHQNQVQNLNLDQAEENDDHGNEDQNVLEDFSEAAKACYTAYMNALLDTEPLKEADNEPRQKDQLTEDKALNFQENLNLDPQPAKVDLNQVGNQNLGQENVDHHNQEHNLHLDHYLVNIDHQNKVKNLNLDQAEENEDHGNKDQNMEVPEDFSEAAKACYTAYLNALLSTEPLKEAENEPPEDRDVNGAGRGREDQLTADKAEIVNILNKIENALLGEEQFPAADE